MSEGKIKLILKFRENDYYLEAAKQNLKTMRRLFITVSDLQIITGTSDRNCQKIMRTLKDSLNKKVYQHITIKEYCQYESIDINEVLEVLNLKKEEKTE